MSNDRFYTILWNFYLGHFVVRLEISKCDTPTHLQTEGQTDGKSEICSYLENDDQFHSLLRSCEKKLFYMVKWWNCSHSFLETGKLHPCSLYPDLPVYSFLLKLLNHGLFGRMKIKASQPNLESAAVLASLLLYTHYDCVNSTSRVSYLLLKNAVLYMFGHDISFTSVCS